MWGRIGQRERAHARAEGSGSGALGSLEQRSGHLVTKGTAAVKTLCYYTAAVIAPCYYKVLLQTSTRAQRLVIAVIASVAIKNCYYAH